MTKRKRAPGAGRPQGSRTAPDSTNIRVTLATRESVSAFAEQQGISKVEAATRLIAAGRAALGE